MSSLEGSTRSAAAHSRSRPLGCFIDIAAGILLTIIAYYVITTFVVQPYQVEQDSMRATLEEGQFVLVDKLTPHFDSYSRGDIVLFNPVRREECSDSASVPLPGSAPYIKRVIGLPGDLIELRDGEVYVNGVVLAEPYVGDLDTGPPDSRWVVPQGRLFVMGDNRPGSIDSRSAEIGAICVGDVIGRAFLRYWPINKLGILPTPTYGPATPASPPWTPASPAWTPASPTPAAHGQTPIPSPPPADAEHLRTEVIGRRPHDITSYTEGLVLADGRLYEASGYGPTLREIDPHTGAPLRATSMDGAYSAEGIAVVDDRVIQLTLQGSAFVYRLSDFSQIAEFTYDTEGWGLCYDGTRLVMSDGTNRLYFRSSSTFELLGTVTVTSEGAEVGRLNELECVDGEVYANVWLTDTIVRIDPSSGKVDAMIDASGLLTPNEEPGDEDAVLNGIAYDTAAQTFLLTGKLWPALFEVHFVAR